MNNVHKSGFVALIGRPNVGKSTFVNKVLGKKYQLLVINPKQLEIKFKEFILLIQSKSYLLILQAFTSLIIN